MYFVILWYYHDTKFEDGIAIHSSVRYGAFRVWALRGRAETPVMSWEMKQSLQAKIFK